MREVNENPDNKSDVNENKSEAFEQSRQEALDDMEEDLAPETEGENLESETPEYASTYEERLKQTPVNNGHWEGERGESKGERAMKPVIKCPSENGYSRLYP